MEAVDDINVGLSDDAGPKVAAWKALALVSTHRQLEDYEEMGKALASATGIDAPRFLARVALAQLDLGRVEAALKARRRIRWAGAEPDRYPLVAALDAELLLASGLADAAVANVDGIDAPVVRKVRGRALFDAGKYEDALAELDKAATLAPGDPEVAMWREAARYVVGGRARRDADQALTKLGLQAKAKDAKTVHGLALRIAGRADAARRRFEQSLEDVSDEYPNALAYRAHVELARMALDGGALEAAEKHLKAALDQNPTYLPARALMGRTLLALGDPNAALEQLVDVIGANVATAADELAFAEALVAGSPSDEDRGQARQALERAAKKGASAEEIARVAALVDPDAAAPDKRRRRRR
ncbi:MAG: hypothetical protein D6689_14955 [Deltaproteobacteria bacterium]|nr:MAG: hypothetical protein D6689_14955 [Deltaproteobacteria bacterium]